MTSPLSKPAGRRLAGSAALTLLLCTPSAPELPGSQERGVRVVLNETGQAAGRYSDSYALLIGAWKYSRGWNTLEGVPAELDLVKKVLVEEGFKPDHVEIHLNPVDRQIDEWIRDFVVRRGYDPDNRLLIMFSGHGATVDNEGFLVPVNAPTIAEDARKLWEMALPMGDVLRHSERIKSKHALFIFDSCFAGTVFKVRSDSLPAKIEQKIRTPTRQFLTSGSANESVPAKSELVPVLVGALRHGDADINADGYTTGAELGLYVEQNVARTLPQFGRHPGPSYSEGDYIFFAGRTERAPSRTTDVREYVIDAHEPADAKAIEQSVVGCERGAGGACHNYGWLFEHGRFVQLNRDLAFVHYEKACALKNRLSCERLVQAFENGETGERHADLARASYERICVGEGSAGPVWQHACRQLGLLYLAGLSVKPDAQRAESLLARTFPTQGEMWDWLGAAFRDARVVSLDHAVATDYFSRSCGTGWTDGCYNLARLVLGGQSATGDIAKAVDFLDNACESGKGEACGELARVYADGAGVEKSRDRARAYLDRACDAGLGQHCRETPAGPFGRYDRSVALVVGVNDYQDFPPLRAARDNAGMVARLLAEQGFETRTLMNPRGSELKKALYELPERVGRSENSRVVFYFAGHGYRSELPGSGEEVGYLVPADARRDGSGLSEMVSMVDVQQMSRVISAKHVLIALDAGVDNAGFKTRGPAQSSLDLGKLWSSKARLLMAAGSPGDVVPDGGPFTPALIEGLRGHADLNGDRIVTGMELTTFVVARGQVGSSFPYSVMLHYRDYDRGDIFFFLPER